MTPFLRLAREMLRYRRTLFSALAFAFISAAGLGIGLLSVIPLLSVILKGERLVDLATRYNAGDPMVPVPAFVMERLPDSLVQSVVFILVPLAILTLIGAFANFMHLYLSMATAAKTTGHLRLDAFHHVMHMPLSRVVERGPAEFIARIIRDAHELQKGFIALASRAVAQITKGAIAFAVAIMIEPGLTLVAIVVGVTLGVVLKKLGKRVRRGTRGALQAQENLLRIATEIIQGLRGVKANTGEYFGLRRFHVDNKEVVRQELKVRTARALSGPIVETLAVLAVGGVAIVAAAMIERGSVAPEAFIGALIALGVSGSSFRPLSGLINEMYASSAPAARLLEILDEPPEIRPGRRAILARHARTITFDRVGLTYPGTHRPALTDVSLEIQHGQRVALVGPNGSGKTTLVSLIPRLLRPTHGRVLIDGVDVESVRLRPLRRQIGVVTQETMLFRGSIAENIAFGVSGVTAEAIESAARAARADEFITAMPGGYDADVAEQGASLSGGQRQRLSIARAILRDPSILILDEATSQIDAESEALINEAISEFCRDRTALIVAHRLSTVRDADRIVVLEDGRIVDDGTHDELLDRCDLYRRLAETQLIGRGA